jgi:DNA primase large subunit
VYVRMCTYVYVFSVRYTVDVALNFCGLQDFDLRKILGNVRHLNLPSCPSVSIRIDHLALSATVFIFHRRATKKEPQIWSSLLMQVCLFGSVAAVLRRLLGEPN